MKSILNQSKTPIRIFAELVDQPNDVLINIAVCIAEQILKFSSHKLLLLDILHQVKSYPKRTRISDLLLCKRRILGLKSYKSPFKSESDPQYWQYKTDQTILTAFICLYHISYQDTNYKEFFNRFIKNATLAFGQAETVRQLQFLRKQTYNFDKAQTQQFHKMKANLSSNAGERVAYREFLKVLKEKL